MSASNISIGPGKPAAIDQLPASIRQKVIDLLLSNDKHAVSKASKLSGVSEVSVRKYRLRHVLPALQVAAKGRGVNYVDSATLADAKAVTKVSMVQGHLDNYRNRLETAMERLETIGSKPDATAAEIAALGPIARAAHENLRILGELTGELGNRYAEQGITINNVYLNVPRALPEDDGPVVDVTAERID